MSLQSSLKPIEVPLFPGALRPSGHIFPHSKPAPRQSTTSRAHSRDRRPSASVSGKPAEQSENAGLPAALTRVLRRLLAEPRGVLEPRPIISSRLESVLALRRIGDNASLDYSSVRETGLCSDKTDSAKDSIAIPSISLRKKAIRAASTLPKHQRASISVVPILPGSSDLVVNCQKLRLRAGRAYSSRSRARPATTIRAESVVMRSISVPRAELLTRDTQTDF
jgi:hypothetical protein